MTSPRRLRVLAGVLAVLVCGAAEWSDDAEAPGRAASMRFRAIESGVPIAVRPLDNSPANLKVADVLARALADRGIAVRDDAPLLLEFTTETESTATPAPRRPLPESRRVDIGRQRDLGRATRSRVDVYSNARNSLLTGIRRPDIAIRYVLRATLAGRDGERLWEGWAEYGAIARDDERIFVDMAPLVGRMVGETTGERHFQAE